MVGNMDVSELIVSGVLVILIFGVSMIDLTLRAIHYIVEKIKGWDRSGDRESL
jgi:Sec-independent protein translocase protein TatA